MMRWFLNLILWLLHRLLPKRLIDEAFMAYSISPSTSCGV